MDFLKDWNICCLFLFNDVKHHQLEATLFSLINTLKVLWWADVREWCQHESVRICFFDPYQHLHRLFVLQSLTDDDEDDESRPLAESLLLSIADLLFCPGFTAQSNKKSSSVSLKSLVYNKYHQLQWGKSHIMLSVLHSWEHFCHLTLNELVHLC